jgi:hypothetical protein
MAAANTRKVTPRKPDRREIKTNYPDFPAVSPLEFNGSKIREDYNDAEKEVLLKRSDYLNRVLTEAVREAEKLDRVFKSNDLETIDFDPIILSMNINFKSIINAKNDLLQWERVEKMHNYETFFTLIELLSKNSKKLNDFVELIPNLKTKPNPVYVRAIRDILRHMPVLIEHLRVTPMGPEANQVQNTCATQFDVDRTEASQKDQCLTTYSMCKDYQKGVMNKIDHTRDLTCLRYIKKRVFPDIAQEDPDVRKYYMNYDYARDGTAFLKERPDLKQHRWEKEFGLWDGSKKGLLQQWDNKVLNLATDERRDYADRGVRNVSNSQEAMNRLIKRAEQARQKRSRESVLDEEAA